MRMATYRGILGKGQKEWMSRNGGEGMRRKTHFSEYTLLKSSNS